MQQITIIGSNTLLGQHLIKTIETKSPKVSLKLWNDDWSLYEALHGSDAVFNLHEVQYLSLISDSQKMKEHNVDFVATLIEKCKLAGCPLIVHLSTIYLQCSIRWPNVYGRESDAFHMYRAECPFPEYCESKYEAEKLIGYADNLCRVIARVGPLYGEGDCHSLVCDSILATEAIGHLPRISNPATMGTFQFTYAGNAADALLACAEKLRTKMGEEETTADQPCETVIICDHTPLRDIYSLLLDPIVNVDDGQKVESDKEEEKDKQSTEAANKEMTKEEAKKATDEAEKETTMPVKMEEDKQLTPKAPIMEQSGCNNIRLGNWHVPFCLFFYPYWLFCMLILMLNKVFRLNSILNKLISPNYLYLILRHWTFYSGYKLRIFFNWRPPFDWETSLKRSRDYYRQLKPAKIHGPSWLPMPTVDHIKNL